MTASQAVFDAELARLERASRERDAILTNSDGFKGIDPEQAPADLLDDYRKLLSYGYANGLI